MRGPEEHVGHAADEEGHPGTLASDGGQELRQLRSGFGRRWQQPDHPSQSAGHQLQQPRLLGQTEQPRALRKPHKRQQPPHATGIGEQPEEDQFTEPVPTLLDPPVGPAHFQAERLDQPAVLDARGTRRLARSAIQAEFQVAAYPAGQGCPAVGHHPHHLDPAAGPVVLVAAFGVRRTGRRAQAAMHALEEQLAVDPRRQVAVFMAVRIVIEDGAHRTSGLHSSLTWGTFSTCL